MNIPVYIGTIFSSPEHTVLKGSLKDHAVSVVRRGVCVVRRPSCVIRRASCGVNNSFEHLLVIRLSDLGQTWQECSLGGPL